MLKKRGKLRRTAIVLATAIPSIGDFVRGLWQSPARNRWLVPLMVFLCVTGVLLTAAATVEALAPFIYSIF
jgi:uncharacterized protein DUF5989